MLELVYYPLGWTDGLTDQDPVAYLVDTLTVHPMHLCGERVVQSIVRCSLAVAMVGQ